MIVTERQDFRKFPRRLSDNSTFMKQSNMGLFERFKFKWKISRGFLAADNLLRITLNKKACFYGPFKGEFGHFLAHTLPFLMYLHREGVKIHYCGMVLHKPFLVDEDGNSIVASFHELRDFFAEVTPKSNSTIPPKDVRDRIRIFEDRVKAEGLPYWNIGNDFYYWFIHRHWLGKGYVHLYDLSKVYGQQVEHACAIFPRSKGAKDSLSNGKSWDYQRLVEQLIPHFEKIYVMGHPSQVLKLNAKENIELVITSDNEQILRSCAKCELIITQHSGVNNLGEYLNKQVLIIYKGGACPEDIGSMNNTLRFREFMSEKKHLHFAFSEEDVLEYVAKRMYL